MYPLKTDDLREPSGLSGGPGPLGLPLIQPLTDLQFSPFYWPQTTANSLNLNGKLILHLIGNRQHFIQYSRMVSENQVHDSSHIKMNNKPLTQ